MGRPRGLAAAIGCAFMLAACSGEQDVGVIGLVEGFAGAVAADEPRAALIGRDILSGGGSAADAATAMAFTMSVTMPTRASLGGGGTCVVYRPAEEQIEAIMFLPRRTEGGGIAPGMVRGLAALQAKYGSFRWAQVVGPAEQLARFGHPISRAFLRDMSARGEALAADAEARETFLEPGPTLPREGDKIEQLTLASVLSGLRRQGAGYFYSGPFAQRYAEGATEVGLPLSEADLREYKPRIVKTVAVPIGNEVAHLPPPPAAAGLVTGEILALIGGSGPRDYAGVDERERPHLLAEAARTAYADRADWLEAGGYSSLTPQQALAPERLAQSFAHYDPNQATPTAEIAPNLRPVLEDANSAGLVAVDKTGNAVACSFTMNGVAGAARMAPGTGVLLAGPQPEAGGGGLSLTPLVVINENTNDLFFAGTSTAGPAAPSIISHVALSSLKMKQDLETAVGSPRLSHLGVPDVVWVESEMSDELKRALQQRGHELRPVPNYGRVNAVSCPRGLKRLQEACQAVSDPRGFGLAQRVE